MIRFHSVNSIHCFILYFSFVCISCADLFPCKFGVEGGGGIQTMLLMLFCHHLKSRIGLFSSLYFRLWIAIKRFQSAEQKS